MNDPDDKTEKRIEAALGAMMRANDPQYRLLWAQVAKELMDPRNGTIH